MSRRILLVGPVFHGYTASLAEVLRQRGHDVTTHLYDRHAGLRTRARVKVVDELPERLGVGSSWTAVQRRATAAAVVALRRSRPELVLVVKGDVLTREFWEEARTSGATTHLWLYDELRRMRVDADVLTAVDVLTSYSALDTATLRAEGLDAVHVPNAFDPTLRWSRREERSLLFVGARYANREELLVQVAARGVPVLAVGREWSRHPVDRLRTWDPRRPPVPGRRDVSRAGAYGLMAGAAANLNMHHDQDGFTMRTFEIPGVGGLQLVDRADVEELYEPGTEVVIARTPEEVAEATRRALEDPRWARRIGEAGALRTAAEHTMVHRAATLESLWR